MAAGNEVGGTVGAIAGLFAATSSRPTAVLIEGEPGIGKTTQLHHAAEDARAQGFTVLSASGAVGESVLAYAGLADLLSGVDRSLLAALPAPQRNALDWVLLRSDGMDGPTDQRAVAAAFLTTVNALAERSPVLLVIDDVQWLDPSSVTVLSFAVRRITGPVSVLAAVRTEFGQAPANWLQLARPEDLRRVQVPPLSPGDMHTMITKRFERSLSRPALMRIHRLSGGNPFYALELARADGGSATATLLPGGLSDLIQARVGNLEPDVQEVLLAAACATTPSVSLLRTVLGNERDEADDRVIAALELAETRGLVTIDGDHLAFTHPLLARGVLDNATSAQRRTVHRELADAVTEPELRARHLALAAKGADADAVAALDAGAASARTRGAPAAAAELLELALRLGGDTPERRILLAASLFDAGEPARARTLLETLLDRLPPGALRGRASHLLGTVRLFGDSFAEAAAVLRQALDEGGHEPELEVLMLLTLSFADYNAGLVAEGVTNATAAVAAAERLGAPVLLSQALGMRVILGFLAGEGFDEAAMRTALELEGDQSAAPLPLRPSVQHALLQAWTGRVADAPAVMRSIWQKCIDAGDEIGANFAAFQAVLVDVWFGDFTDLAVRADDARERALQVGSDVALFTALTMTATAATYAGDEEAARRDIEAALAAAERSNTRMMLGWTLHLLGFLEVSRGNYEAAWAALEPMAQMLESQPASSELVVAQFVPDAIEAAVALDRLDVAERLADILESNGRRLERGWMLAVSARGRAMVLAARGDLPGAVAAARQATERHEGLPMPFERARTQLLLGQLLRRQRLKEPAAAELTMAIDTFTELGARLWAERARTELGRANIGPHRDTALTPSEQRVAELAATGFTNREVAAALFISPKTVEANLARVYRKFGIRTRAELGQRMSRPNRGLAD